jgi:antitoxin component of RelBE/YafQ-DinJ toxin-antitoxin module
MATYEEWPIAIDDSTKARLREISKEMGRDINDLIRTSVEEAALNYFRGRSDDPGSTGAI